MAHQVLSLRLLSRAEEEGLCLLCLNRQPGGNQAQVHEPLAPLQSQNLASPGPIWTDGRGRLSSLPAKHLGERWPSR